MKKAKNQRGVLGKRVTGTKEKTEERELEISRKEGTGQDPNGKGRRGER